MVIGHRAASVMQLIAPHPITQVHASNNIHACQIGEDSPDGGLVVEAGREKAPDRLVGQGRVMVVPNHQHGESLRSRTHPLSLQECADFSLDTFKFVWHGLRRQNLTPTRPMSNTHF